MKIHTKTYREFPPSLWFIVALLFFFGCEQQPTEVEDYEPQAVLQGYLINGQPVDRIYLQWVAPLQGYYDANDYSIADANMIIYPMNQPGDTLHLVQHPSPDSSWVYVPAPGEELVIQGKVRYRIEVKQPEAGLDVWSEALVPDTFSCWFQSPPLPVGVDTLDSLNREDPNLFLSWVQADSAGGYNLNVTCLTPEDSLLPLDPDFNPDEDELDLTEVDRTMFWPMRYDQFEMLVPWFMFNFEGWHRIDLQAISQEYYDYGLSIFRFEQGFSIELESNVHGGLGIFAGLAQKSFWVYMERVE